jgi:putative membrane protein insertion efficiency factor
MSFVVFAAEAVVRLISSALTTFLIVLIRAYQIFLSPAHGPSCRFQPSCSAYAIEALKRHGPIWGLALTGWRLARCHPLGGGKVSAVETATGDVSADLFIAALGSFTPELLKPLGLDLPIYPVKGYSITVPIVNEPLAPVSTVMDETYKVAITRLGDRIRAGGMAEIARFSTDLPPNRRATLEHSVEDLFGGAGDQKRALFWSGLRPMTPDGTPIISSTRYPNLFVNAGHGTLGWTMSCGSARVLADLVSGVKPEIKAGDLNLTRYDRSVEFGRSPTAP